MIIKLEKIIHCTSEHPSYPASNLLQQRSNTSWRCSKPGVLLASVTFQLSEASTITGLDIGNYRSCIVIVTASTTDEPDNWIPIINHQFMTHEEAANGKFKDQVQIFTKKELNADTIKIKFNRIKVTCMQSANLRELFGLSFIVFKTEVAVQMGADIFGRFKLKESATSLDTFKEKCLKQIGEKPRSYKETLAQKIKDEAADKFAKRQESPRELVKRPILEKMAKNEEKYEERNEKIEGNEKIGENVKIPENEKLTRTPFGDIVNSDRTNDGNKKNGKRPSNFEDDDESSFKGKKNLTIKGKCDSCEKNSNLDKICDNCGKLPPQKAFQRKILMKKPKIVEKPKKPFGKLFEDVSFALSGYVNPQRDEIRKKALTMGGKYVADPNITNNKCTHLVCAFKNTPKSQQLRGHAKIVSHKFIEESFDKKTRFPWRRFALDSKEKAEPESEEEIEGSTSSVKPPDPYQEETDPDSDY